LIRTSLKSKYTKNRLKFSEIDFIKNLLFEYRILISKSTAIFIFRNSTSHIPSSFKKNRHGKININGLERSTPLTFYIIPASATHLWTGNFFLINKYFYKSWLYCLIHSPFFIKSRRIVGSSIRLRRWRP